MPVDRKIFTNASDMPEVRSPQDRQSTDADRGGITTLARLPQPAPPTAFDSEKRESEMCVFSDW